MLIVGDPRTAVLNPETAALEYHAQPRPGKLSVELTKPTVTARDLSLDMKVKE